MFYEIETQKLQLEKTKITNAAMRKDAEYRDKLAGRFFPVCASWMGAVVLVMVFEGFHLWKFHLDNSVLIAFIGTTTADVLGPMSIAAQYHASLRFRKPWTSMLFTKPIVDLRFEDLEEFCRRFHENTRVEYKSTFDDSVKKKLPKVLSSFANSYGGIVIIGVNASAGVPQEPFEGIVFPEREPGLTVQNICRDNIYPEIPLYTSFVPSRVTGQAFLVLQVNESAKAPHAIENSTQVYVRTEGATEKLELADIARIERMLLRRADVSRRWDEFFSQSWSFARSVNVNQKYAYREIRIGPLYPAEVLITREAIYAFLSDAKCREMAGFRLGQVVRSPIGALLARDQNVDRFLDVGELGILHYVEPLYYDRNYQGETKQTLDFWPMAVAVLRMVRLSAALIEYAKASCELRIEAHLRKIEGQSFSSGPNPNLSLPISTVADTVPASVQCSSQNITSSALDITVELMYQLRWPFGEETPPSCDDVRQTVEKIVTGI